MNIIKTIAAATAALAALTLGASAANAQDINNTMKPFNVKIGAYFPTDDDAQDPGGNALFAIEGEYSFGESISPSGMRSISRIGIGYIGNNDLSIVPITVSQIYENLDGRPYGRFYYGGGIGVYVTSISEPHENGRDKGLVGGFLTAGLNFSQATYLEAKYHIISRYNTRRVDGLQLSFGARF